MAEPAEAYEAAEKLVREAQARAEQAAQRRGARGAAQRLGEPRRRAGASPSRT